MLLKNTLSILLTLFLLANSVCLGQPSIDVEIARVEAMEADTSKVMAFVELSEMALKENFDKGRDFAQMALDLAKQLKFERGAYLAHQKLGRANGYLGDYRLAFENYEIACAYAKSKGDRKGEANMLNRMGESKRQLDQYEEALEYLQGSLKINQELGDTNAAGSGYISIGIFYAVRGEREEAENYFLQAIKSFKAVGNQQSEYLTKLNMAGLYNEMGEHEKSVEFSTEAQNYFKEQGPEIRLGVVHFNLGVAYFELNELEKSRQQFLNSLELFERLGDKIRSNGSILRLAEIDLRLGNTTTALANAEMALANFLELHSMTRIARAYNIISDIHKAGRDFEKALEYRLLYEKMRDSVDNEETESRIAELEEKYQSEVKDRKLKQAMSEIDMRELVHQKQQNQRYALIGLVGFILVILAMVFRQYGIKKKNNEALQDKNALIEKSLKEKEVLLREIHHRVKNNLQFISSLLNLQARHVKDKDALATLIEGKNRVQSMALVHQKLYQEENLKGVQMKEYMGHLVESLVHSLKVDKTKIEYQVNVEPMYLDIDTAMPIGIIFNELITNAFKYAFEGQSHGKLEVVLRKTEEHLELIVADNGVGLPADFGQDTEKSFGYQLINSLATKLKATVKTDSTQGTRVVLSISQF